MCLLERVNWTIIHCLLLTNNLRLHVIENPDVDFEIWILESAIKCKIWKQILPPRNLSSGRISTKRSKIQISLISFLSFDWEIGKRICKTILMNSSLLFATRAHATPLFIRTVFLNPLLNFPKWFKGKIAKKICVKSKSVAQLLGCTDCIVSFSDYESTLYLILSSWQHPKDFTSAIKVEICLST